jgi:hypothetical protein
MWPATATAGQPWQEPWPGRRSKASQMAACWQKASPKSVEHTYTFLIFRGMVQELNPHLRQAALDFSWSIRFNF